jgi:hypothetical protein
LADIPVAFILFILVFLVLKAFLFDYEKYILDTDPRGEK